MTMDSRLMETRTIEQTADGSATIYLPLLDEHYHSVKGAYTESKHVFLDCGLRFFGKPHARVLEIGFGTGLNATLTAACQSCRTDYYTLERFPLPPETMAQTGYYCTLPAEEAALMKAIHTAPWGRPVEISSSFSLCKLQTDLTDSSIPLPEAIDIVYFDAFAPEKQPEMWTEEIFRRIYAAMTPGGILTTYCAKGEIRRRLQQVGFAVERLAGPPGGKREILRATK